MLQILYGCSADGGAEASQAFTFADRCTGRNGSGAELTSELTVDTGQHGFHPLGIPEILAVDGCSSRGEVAAEEPYKL